MNKECNVLNKISSEMDNFSKRQKKLAEYILAHYDKAAFLTAVRLGEQIGISESTVVRFATTIGYSGYPELQKELAAVIQNRVNTIERIEISAEGLKKDMVLDKVLTADAEKIRVTLESLDRKSFDMAVDILLKAKTIYIVGIRSCAPLAQFLSYYLKLIFSHVVLVESCNTSEIFEQMLHIGEGDVVIGISFPRYSMRTLKAMEYANNRNAQVIAITDNKHSPMNMYSSCNLLARSDMASIVDSLVAPLSLINALIVAVCIQKKKDVITNLENLEQVLYDYQFNNNDEINLLDDDLMEELKKLEPLE